jgi:hypothetical protein
MKLKSYEEFVNESKLTDWFKNKYEQFKNKLKSLKGEAYIKLLGSLIPKEILNLIKSETVKLTGQKESLIINELFSSPFYTDEEVAKLSDEEYNQYLSKIAQDVEGNSHLIPTMDMDEDKVNTNEISEFLRGKGFDIPTKININTKPSIDNIKSKIDSMELNPVAKKLLKASAYTFLFFMVFVKGGGQAMAAETDHGHKHDNNKETGHSDEPFTGKEYSTDKDFFRATGVGESPDVSYVEKLGEQEARVKIEGQVNQVVKDLLKNFDDKYKGQFDISSKIETITKNVSQNLKNTQFVDSKKRMDSSSGTYRYYVVIELKKENLKEALKKELRNNVSEKERPNLDSKMKMIEEEIDSQLSKTTQSENKVGGDKDDHGNDVYKLKVDGEKITIDKKIEFKDGGSFSNDELKEIFKNGELDGGSLSISTFSDILVKFINAEKGPEGTSISGKEFKIVVTKSGPKSTVNGAKMAGLEKSNLISKDRPSMVTKIVTMESDGKYVCYSFTKVPKD